MNFSVVTFHVCFYIFSVLFTNLTTKVFSVRFCGEFRNLIKVRTRKFLTLFCGGFLLIFWIHHESWSISSGLLSQVLFASNLLKVEGDSSFFQIYGNWIFLWNWFKNKYFEPFFNQITTGKALNSLMLIRRCLCKFNAFLSFSCK